jgi:hypothetical protein
LCWHGKIDVLQCMRHKTIGQDAARVHCRRPFLGLNITATRVLQSEQEMNMVDVRSSAFHPAVSL